MSYVPYWSQYIYFSLAVKCRHEGLRRVQRALTGAVLGALIDRELWEPAAHPRPARGAPRPRSSGASRQAQGISPASAC